MTAVLGVFTSAENHIWFACHKVSDENHVLGHLAHYVRLEQGDALTHIIGQQHSTTVNSVLYMPVDDTLFDRVNEHLRDINTKYSIIKGSRDDVGVTSHRPKFKGGGQAEVKALKTNCSHFALSHMLRDIAGIDLTKADVFAKRLSGAKRIRYIDYEHGLHQLIERGQRVDECSAGDIRAFRHPELPLFAAHIDYPRDLRRRFEAPTDVVDLIRHVASQGQMIETLLPTSHEHEADKRTR